MITTLINIGLLLIILLLVWPQPLKVTLKRLTPIFLAVGAVLSILVLAQWNTEQTFTVRAPNQRNTAAEGGEIWIKAVVVDGTEYMPEEFFSEGWISEGGYLKWRGYDRPTGMKDSISAVFPAGTEVDILFETNKWRGIAQVQEGKWFSTIYQVDCYSDSGNVGHNFLSYRASRTVKDFRVYGTALFLCLFGLLAVLAACFRVRKTSTPVPLTQTDRELWLDVLKVISAPMIVLIHSAGWTYNTSSAGSARWFIFLLINTIPRFAVPVFIMVSGILMIGRTHTMEKTWRKVKRALLLLVVWNLIYIIVYHLTGRSSESIASQILALPVKCGPSAHLWYSYFLVWLYLFAPIVNALYSALNNRMRIYFVLITVIIPGIFDYYQRFFHVGSEEVVHTTHIWMTLNYIGIMVAGRLIYDNIKRWPAKVYLSAAIAGFVGAVLISYIYGVANKTSPHNFYMETQLFPVCYGCGVLGLTAALKEKIECIPRFCKEKIVTLSKYSIGVYFFHILAIQLPEGLRSSADSPLKTVTLGLVFYLLSVAGVILMAQIPFLKKLVT